MTLRQIYARIGQIIEQNDKLWSQLESAGINKGADSVNRNDRQIMIKIDRGGRKEPWYYPIHYVSSALTGVTLRGLNGPERHNIIEIKTDANDVRTRSKYHANVKDPIL